MQTSWQSTLDPHERDAYSAFLEGASDGHFTQDPAFAAVAVAGKRRATRFFVAREGKEIVGVAAVLRVRALGPLLAPVGIVQRGPACGDPSKLEAVLRALVRTSRFHGIARLAVMPYWAGAQVEQATAALVAAGFHSVQEVDGAHAFTLRLDIGGKSDEQILSGSDHKKLRYELKSAERAGVVVRRGEAADFAVVEKLERELALAQGRRVQSPEWFAALASYMTKDDRRGAFFVSSHDGEPIAAALVLRHAKTTVYLAGASIVAPRPYSKMALPLFAAVKWARDVGCDVFDLGGVPAEGDTDPKRAAIAQFKRDFSKTPVPLVPEHARWF